MMCSECSKTFRLTVTASLRRCVLTYLVVIALFVNARARMEADMQQTSNDLDPSRSSLYGTRHFENLHSHQTSQREIRRNHRRRRRLHQDDSTGNGQNILKVFHAVWAETTYVSSSGVETTCLKPISFVSGDVATKKPKDGTTKQIDGRYLMSSSGLHRAVQINTEDEDGEWGNILAGIVQRNSTGNETNSSTTVRDTAPYTANPLSAPITVAPFAAPKTVAPVSSTVRATSSAPLFVSTLAPATVTLADPSSGVIAQPPPKTKDSKKNKDSKVKSKKGKGKKSKKKLPFCNELYDGYDEPGSSDRGDDDVGDESNTSGDHVIGDDDNNPSGDHGVVGDDDNNPSGDHGVEGDDNNNTGRADADNAGDPDGVDGGIVTRPSKAPFKDGRLKPDLTSLNPSDAPSIAPSERPSFGVDGLNTRESVCDNFFAGVAIPSNASNAVYSINLGVLLDKGSNTSSTAKLMMKLLNEDIAPALLGCDSTSRRRELITKPFSLFEQMPNYHKRQLEQFDSTNGTDFLGMTFHSATESKNGSTCSSGADSVCLPLNVICNVSYYGDELTTFVDTLRRALLFWDWNDIPGWLGFSAVQINQTVSDSISNSTGSTGDGDGASGVQEVDRNQDDNRSNTAAILSAAAAAAILLVITYFVMRQRQREKVEKEIDVRNIQLTDDEYDDEKLITHDIPFEKSYVLTDGDEVDQNYENNDDDDEGTEVLAMRVVDDYKPAKSYESLDESSYYNYPSRHIVTHRIGSFESENYKATTAGNSNSRSYRVPENTIDL